ncbi:MAG: TIGR04282 family arsenosugar biosynthesis glycosyltransferase [Saprospiraceae bacterium]
MKTNILVTKAIIIFIKNPVIGKVKTRIAKDVGDKIALEIYKKLLIHIHDTILKTSNIKLFIYYSDHVNNNDMWNDKRFVKRLQSDGDIGVRMSKALDAVLQDCDSAILIGSDCAQLSFHHLVEALDNLENNDIVLGPTFDGGYYLIGMNYHYPKLFNGITWSTNTVFSKTEEIIKTLNLSSSHIEKLSDIDYIEDWNKYGLDNNSVLHGTN